MAPGDTKFSHITVNADDEDEFVIQAGARSADESTRAVESEVAAKGSVETSADEQPDGAVQVTKQETEAVEQSSDAKPAHKHAEYRETTAEDLKGEPMPAAQKVVIAVAVLFIVAFIVYYLFMR